MLPLNFMLHAVILSINDTDYIDTSPSFLEVAICFLIFFAFCAIVGFIIALIFRMMDKFRK